ncbi:hypothetical protein MMC30_008559 [Trapelia coarctata]|nr:hypothetical protein [Trapelia coarctata]
MDAHWRTLPLGSVSNLSLLLFKLNISASAYTIYLTDLTHIWTESLDRKRIIRRAFDENASIDPSEGPDQFKLLLDHIQGALEARTDTSLEIQLPKAAADTLTLNLKAKLPSPLDPLIWPVFLTRAPEGSFFDEFLFPGLRSLGSARSEVVSLISYIKEKDKVIAKLADKLEATGIELCTVFPSAAPSKRSKTATREFVMNSVKGLRGFDEDRWRETIAVRPEKDLKTLCGELFADGTPAVGRLDQEPHETMALSSRKKVSRKPGQEATETGAAHSLSRFDSADDGFQRQITPTRDSLTDSDPASAKESIAMDKGKKSGPPATEVNHSASDTSDNDLDGSTSRTKHALPVSQTAPKKGITKLGILGGKKKDLPKAASPPTRSPSVDSADMRAGSADYVGDISRGSQASPSKPKGKLGKIGGLRKVGKKTEEHRAVEHVTASNASASAKGASHATSTSVRGRESVKKPAPPVPERETSQERADRNRERLKRELEEKSKAAAKKKRKF